MYAVVTAGATLPRRGVTSPSDDTALAGAMNATTI
jgi:hypothetical protein